MEEETREEGLFGNFLIQLNKSNRLRERIAMIRDEIDNHDEKKELPPRKSVRAMIPEPPFKKPNLTKGSNKDLPNASNKLKLIKENNTSKLIAEKNIKFGDVLLVEKAAILPNHPNRDARNTIYRCYHCLKIIVYFVTCPGCDVVFFCGYKCRYYACNEYHQWECYAQQRGFFINNDRIYISMRMLFFSLQFEENAIFKDYYNKEYNYEHFKNLPYKINIDKDKLYGGLEDCADVIIYLWMHTSFFDWLRKLPKYKDKGLFKIFSELGGSMLRFLYQFEENYVNVKQMFVHVLPPQEFPDLIADGLFLSSQFFTKSPHPNTVWFLWENYMIIKACQDIPAGEKITVRWRNDINMCSCKEICQPKALLNSFWCTDCKCEIMPIEESDFDLYFDLKYIRSIRGINKHILLKCKTCLKKSDLNYFKYTIEHAEDSLQLFKENKTFVHLNAAYNECVKVLHPNHIYFLSINEVFLDYYLNNNDVPNFICKAHEIINDMELHYEKFSLVYLRTLIYLLFKANRYYKKPNLDRKTLSGFLNHLVSNMEGMAHFYYLLPVIQPVIERLELKSRFKRIRFDPVKTEEKTDTKNDA